MVGSARRHGCVEIRVEMAQRVRTGHRSRSSRGRYAVRSPLAAARSRRSRRSAAMPASITPAASPRQPAWIAATARPSALAASTGTQSAVTTTDRLAARVTTASASMPGAHILRLHHARSVHLARPQQARGGASPRVPKPWPTPHASSSGSLDHAAPSLRSSAARRAAKSAGSSASKRSRSPLLGCTSRARARAAPGGRGRARRGRVRRGRSGIARDRQPHRREVHADLMGAPRLGSHLEQAARTLREAPRHAPRGVRLAASALHDRHALAVARVARDRRIDAPGFARGIAAHERLIHALDAMPVELRGERAVCVVVLRHHDYARRAAVEPVHDPRAQHSADRGEPAAVVQQRVHERAARVARRGMHDHVGGFVDHDDRRILVENAQRDRFGQRAAAGSARAASRRSSRQRLRAGSRTPRARSSARGRRRSSAAPASATRRPDPRAPCRDAVRPRSRRPGSAAAPTAPAAYLRENMRRLPVPRRSSQRCR